MSVPPSETATGSSTSAGKPASTARHEVSHETRQRWAARLRRFRRALVPHRPTAFRDSLNRWLLMGTVIGIVSGLGAVLFFFCLETGTHWLLEFIGGYTPPATLGEGGGGEGSGLTRPWAIPLVVTGGALVAGILVHFVAPTAKGHGTDNAIYAAHHDPTSLRGKVAVVKIIASSLVIGSGGSGGREGPAAQISATVISSLAKKLRIPTPDARIAVSAATASGIGAIFRAPLGGALLGAELLYRDDLESDAIMPSLISSIVAFVVFGSVYGFDPIFGSLTGVQFSEPLQLFWFVLLGLAAGVMGKLYAVVFYKGTDLFDASGIPGWLAPAVGALGVGLLGLVVPAALGTGYGNVQQEMFADHLMSMPLLLVLAIPFAKILSTTLSIGSGGSGGVFGPGMVIGGATGAAMWRLCEGLPGIPASPMSFVIVGMIACFGSVAHAPLGMMLMVGEMTGNLSMLAPGMIAVAVASRVVGEVSIYRAQLKDRLEGRKVHAMSRVTSGPGSGGGEARGSTGREGVEKAREDLRKGIKERRDKVDQKRADLERRRGEVREKVEQHRRERGHGRPGSDSGRPDAPVRPASPVPGQAGDPLTTGEMPVITAATVAPPAGDPATGANGGTSGAVDAPAAPGEEAAARDRVVVVTAEQRREELLRRLSRSRSGSNSSS